MSVNNDLVEKGKGFGDNRRRNEGFGSHSCRRRVRSEGFEQLTVATTKVEGEVKYLAVATGGE